MISLYLTPFHLSCKWDWGVDLYTSPISLHGPDLFPEKTRKPQLGFLLIFHGPFVHGKCVSSLAFSLGYPFPQSFSFPVSLNATNKHTWNASVHKDACLPASEIKYWFPNFHSCSMWSCYFFSTWLLVIFGQLSSVQWSISCNFATPCSAFVTVPGWLDTSVTNFEYYE